MGQDDRRRCVAISSGRSIRYPVELVVWDRKASNFVRDSNPELVVHDSRRYHADEEIDRYGHGHGYAFGSRPRLCLGDGWLITKRDYYAGMLETLTKLYDGKFQKRVLRKETLEVRDPVLVLFAGGIKDRILQLLSYEHIDSGFVPRFCFITAESDVTRLRPLGPPTERTMGIRHELIERMRRMKDYYVRPVSQTELPMPMTWEAQLTPGAWQRYNRIENDMMQAALDSNIPSSFYYIEQWMSHTMYIIANAGKTSAEHTLDKVLKMITDHPDTPRSRVMQNMRLNAREAENIFLTLEQRGHITRRKNGRGEVFRAIDNPLGRR
jgi:hypothetical protein